MIPIRPETHGDLGWSPIAGFSFARRVLELPLATWEIARAAQAMPVVFEKHNDGWQALAIMGASDGVNAYVARDGRWSADYLPAIFRLYPFCVNDEGDLCLDAGFTPGHMDTTGVTPFFNNGELSGRLTQIRRFLSLRRRGIRAVGKGLTLLAETNALLPQNRSPASGSRAHENQSDMFVVDAERLAAIDDARVIMLFRLGALRWLHAHLDSLHHLDRLDRRAKILLASELSGVGSEALQPGVADLVSAIADDAGDADQWMHGAEQTR